MALLALQKNSHETPVIQVLLTQQNSSFFKSLETANL